MIKVVNTDGLNFRTGPSTSYKIISVLTRGTEVEIISESNGWSYIKVNGQTGYVTTQYLIVKTTSITPTSQQVIDIAKSKIGCPYVWGAQGPSQFDCSGLVYYIFATILKMNIPRVSKEQSKYGKAVAIADLQPADLLFFDTDGINNGNVTHVGIYIGNNEFIQAQTGSVMKVSQTQFAGYYKTQFVNARRYL